MPDFNFEVRVLREKRWVVDRIFDSESVALKHAGALVNANHVDGVQVAKERVRADGTFSSGTIIFDQKCSGQKSAPVQISPIDWAPMCESLRDVYGLESRLVMWRVLRKYFEHVQRTPIEVLHSYHALSKLMDNDPPVYTSALDRIATLQAKALGIDAKERRDQLFAWGDSVASRARAAEKEKRLRKFGLKNYKALCEAALEEGGPKRRDHLIRWAIARDFYTERSLMVKLEALFAAVDEDLPREDLAILDSFIADILGSATVVQEILGTRLSLYHALVGLVDLMEGKSEEKPPANEPQIVVALRKLMAESKLPSGAQALLERLKSQVASKQPLERHNPEKEDGAFAALISRLGGPKGFMGGAEMAEALTERCGLRFSEGGAAGRRKALTSMLKLIKDPSQRIRYLLSIAATETGEQTMDVIIGTIEQITDSARDIHIFVHSGLSVPRKLRAVTDLQKALLESVLSGDVRQRLFERLDDLLADFVEREGFIERIDDPALSLRERATRLVAFCGSGILLEGKALKIARLRIAEHLRQPNFIERFTEGCPPSQADVAVREFYRQLHAAGFAAAPA